MFRLDPALRGAKTALRSARVEVPKLIREQRIHGLEAFGEELTAQFPSIGAYSRDDGTIRAPDGRTLLGARFRRITAYLGG